MHQIQLPLGLCPRPCLGSLQRSPRAIAVFKGPRLTSKEREGEGKGRERRGSGGRGRTTLRTPEANSWLRHCTRAPEKGFSGNEDFAEHFYLTVAFYRAYNFSRCKKGLLSINNQLLIVRVSDMNCSVDKCSACDPNCNEKGCDKEGPGKCDKGCKSGYILSRDYKCLGKWKVCVLWRLQCRQEIPYIVTNLMYTPRALFSRLFLEFFSFFLFIS